MAAAMQTSRVSGRDQGGDRPAAPSSRGLAQLSYYIPQAFSGLAPCAQRRSLVAGERGSAVGPLGALPVHHAAAHLLYLRRSAPSGAAQPAPGARGLGPLWRGRQFVGAAVPLARAACAAVPMHCRRRWHHQCCCVKCTLIAAIKQLPLRARLSVAGTSRGRAPGGSAPRRVACANTSHTSHAASCAPCGRCFMLTRSCAPVAGGAQGRRHPGAHHGAV